tara:strand:- start:1066 stop:1254 length:189 start_codon:yes stop_codon:yes gene_type:complete
MTLAQKIAAQRRAKAESIFRDATLHHEVEPYGRHMRALSAQGFALLRAARRADNGDTSPLEA